MKPWMEIHSFIHSFIGVCRIRWSLLFSGASSIPLYHVLFPATLLHRLFFHPLSPHLAIYFLACLSILLFPNSYTRIILFLEFYFIPFSVDVQTNVIYLTYWLLATSPRIFCWRFLNHEVSYISLPWPGKLSVSLHDLFTMVQTP